jgi:hypothetical protein
MPQWFIQPVHYVMDVGKWEGLGNQEFFGPVKWHRADRWVPFGAQNTWNGYARIQNIKHTFDCTGCINHRCICFLCTRALEGGFRTHTLGGGGAGSSTKLIKLLSTKYAPPLRCKKCHCNCKARMISVCKKCFISYVPLCPTDSQHCK